MKQLVFAFLITIVACKAETTGPSNSDARWELRQINGRPTIVGMPAGDTIPQIRLFCNTSASATSYTMQVIITPKRRFSTDGTAQINFELSPSHDIFANGQCNWQIDSKGNASCTQATQDGIRAFAGKMATATSVELSYFAEEKIFAKTYTNGTLQPLMSSTFDDCDAAFSN